MWRTDAVGLRVDLRRLRFELLGPHERTVAGVVVHLGRLRDVAGAGLRVEDVEGARLLIGSRRRRALLYVLLCLRRSGRKRHHERHGQDQADFAAGSDPTAVE